MRCLYATMEERCDPDVLVSGARWHLSKSKNNKKYDQPPGHVDFEVDVGPSPPWGMGKPLASP